MNTSFARLYEAEIKIHLFILLIQKISHTLFKNKTLSHNPAISAVELCTLCQTNNDINAYKNNKSNSNSIFEYLQTVNRVIIVN